MASQQPTKDEDKGRVLPFRPRAPHSWDAKLRLGTSRLMTLERQFARNGWQAISRFVRRVNAIIGVVAQPSFTQLALRVGLATPFWRSGVNKWDGFLQLNDVAVPLFSTEFKLHLPGGPYSFPVPEVMAFLVGSAEILFPILLVLGLATRPAACGLLMMTLIVWRGGRDDCRSITGAAQSMSFAETLLWHDHTDEDDGGNQSLKRLPADATSSPIAPQPLSLGPCHRPARR